METVGKGLLTLCLVCIAAGLCRMLAPTGKMAKSMSMFTGVFVLVCVATPFFSAMEWNWVDDFSLETFTPVIAEGTLADMALEAAREETVATVEEVARSLGITLTHVQAEVSQQEEQIMVQLVRVEGNMTPSQQLALETQLAKRVTCDIIVIGGETDDE